VPPGKTMKGVPWQERPSATNPLPGG